MFTTRDATANAMATAVAALCDFDVGGAQRSLLTIDFEAIRTLRAETMTRVWGPVGVARGHKRVEAGSRRTSTRIVDVRATFSRDCYTCRYAHCRRPTVAPDVLKQLSKVFPDVLPYHRNWRPVPRHIVYWVYATSLEHKVAFPAGGTSDASNLLTACYLCNDVKNDIPVDLLGWSLTDPAESGWNGLTEFLPRLRAAVAELTREREAGS